MTAAEVAVRIEGTLGRITLDRPRAINALTLAMVRTIAAALADWRGDAAVRAVLLDGAGERGFCAGGDIRAIWQGLAEGDDGRAFWGAEYRLNWAIATYPKPVVALMDGIVMGGGIGLSAHAGHRVVTERTRFAMPETAIGFTPDVGGSWKLARAPGQLGTHLALTAGQGDGADALLCGLADMYVPAARLAAVAAALQGAADDGAVRVALTGLAAVAPVAPLAAARGWIDEAYAGGAVEAILQRLAARPEPAAAAAAAAIGRNSPRALKVALAGLRRAAGLPGLADGLRQEYRLALASARQADFREGVRAQIIDKDRAPRWSPSSLAEVTQPMVEQYFVKPDCGDLALG